MVMDLFEALLQEFSKATNIPNLKPDANSSCLLVLPNGTKIQLDIDPGNNFLLMGAELGFIPGGRYRENVFKEALRANNLPAPRNGDFAYSKKKDLLILFTKISLKDLNGEKIASVFAPFSEKATHWKEAISKGEVPSLSGAFSTHKSGTGMFGL